VHDNQQAILFRRRIRMIEKENMLHQVSGSIFNAIPPVFKRPFSVKIHKLRGHQAVISSIRQDVKLEKLLHCEVNDD
jgi:hypothetical protein